MSTYSRILVDKLNNQSIIGGPDDPTGAQGAQGTLFLRNNGSAGTTLYIKTGPLTSDWSPIAAGGASSVAWNDITSKPTGLVSSSAQLTPQLYTWTGLHTWAIAGEFNAGAATLKLKPGSADHTYLELYARTASPLDRSGYVGFGSAAGVDMSVANQLNGALQFITNNTLAATLTSTGQLTIVGSRVNASDGAPLIARNGAYTEITDPANGTTIKIGDGTVNSNFYDQTQHVFRTRGGGGNYATIGTTGITLTANRVNQTNGNPMLLMGATYTNIYDVNNNVPITIGGTGDPANYYNNTQHIFRNRADQTAMYIAYGTNVTQMIFNRGPGGGTAGQVFADSSNFGLLYSNGNWAVRTSTTDLTINDTAGSARFNITSGVTNINGHLIVTRTNVGTDTIVAQFVNGTNSGFYITSDGNAGSSGIVRISASGDSTKRFQLASGNDVFFENVPASGLARIYNGNGRLTLYGSAGDANQGIWFSNDEATWFFGKNGDAIRLYRAGTDLMTISNAGNVTANDFILD